jgi:DNA-binding response OmpR family regulator
MLVPGRFSSAAIGIGDGEVEIRLSDGGNWQVKVRLGKNEDWRLLCRGHVDGSIFETGTPTDQKPITVGPLVVDPAARRVEVRGNEVRLAAHEFEVIAMLATDPAGSSPRRSCFARFGGPGAAARFALSTRM